MVTIPVSLTYGASLPHRSQRAQLSPALPRSPPRPQAGLPSPASVPSHKTRWPCCSRGYWDVGREVPRSGEGRGQPDPAPHLPRRQAACSTWTPATRPCWTTRRPSWRVPCASAAAWRCYTWRMPACQGGPSCCSVSPRAVCWWARAAGRVPWAWPVTVPSPAPPATALKMNMTLRELYLADNKLNGLQDSAQLGNLLKFNCSLQILDLRNNHVLDSGVCEGRAPPPNPGRPAPTVCPAGCSWYEKHSSGRDSPSPALVVTPQTGLGCGSPGQVSGPVWGSGRNPGGGNSSALPSG